MLLGESIGPVYASDDLKKQINEKFATYMVVIKEDIDDDDDCPWTLRFRLYSVRLRELLTLGTYSS